MAIVQPEGSSQWKLPNHPLENQNRNLPTCNAVRQPTATPRHKRICCTELFSTYNNLNHQFLSGACSFLWNIRMPARPHGCNSWDTI